MMLWILGGLAYLLLVVGALAILAGGSPPGRESKQDSWQQGSHERARSPKHRAEWEVPGDE